MLLAGIIIVLWFSSITAGRFKYILLSAEMNIHLLLFPAQKLYFFLLALDYIVIEW